MEEIKKELKSKIKARITFLPAVIAKMDDKKEEFTEEKEEQVIEEREKMPWKQLYESSN